jgi:hypothetical protein
LACLIVCAASASGGESGDQHPLVPVMQMAYERYEQVARDVRDYSCTLVKRDRVAGVLLDPEYLFVKIRHEQVENGRVVEPFSVYVRFLGPADVKDREVVYVAGANGGKMIARRGGPRLGSFTTALSPQSDVAMSRTRYPLTEIGMLNLIARLLEVGNEELDDRDVEVTYVPGAKVNERRCTLIQMTHPTYRPHYRYHVARIFIDDELQLPIRYASYGWPGEEGGKPRLLEEYTYLDVRLNPGFTDWDFDYRNEGYGFRKEFQP